MKGRRVQLHHQQIHGAELRREQRRSERAISNQARAADIAFNLKCVRGFELICGLYFISMTIAYFNYIV